MTRHRYQLPLVLSALAIASLAGAGAAEAGRYGGGVHFSGGAHFSGGVHVGGGGVRVGGGVHVAARGGYYGGYRGGYGGYRGGWRGGYWGAGHVWIGGYYPYYPYYYGAEYVPSYYAPQPYAQPVVGGPGIAAVAVPVRPPLPRFGIGLFAGGVATDYNTQTNTSETDVGVLARYRLTEGLLIEGELGKVSTSVTQNGQTTDNVRVDRRLGGSLIYEIGAYNKFAPYILAGLGIQQASVDGNYNTTQDYAEVGVGLRYAFTPNFHVTFDVRAGSRTSVSNDQASTLPANTTAAMVAPPASNASNNSEDYTRARLAAVLYF